VTVCIIKLLVIADYDLMKTHLLLSDKDFIYYTCFWS